MGFDSRISRTTQSTIGRFANCTVVVTLNGVRVAEFLGIFDAHAEVVSPFEAERTIVKPMLTVESPDMDNVTSSHVLEITGRQYKFDGKPKPDGNGLTVVYLAEKK